MFLFISCLAVTSRHRDLAVLRLSLFPWLQKACGWLRRNQDWWTPQGEPCSLPWGHRAKERDKHVFFHPCFQVNQLSVAMSPPSWPCLS